MSICQDLEVRFSLRLRVGAGDDDDSDIVSFIRVIGGVNYRLSITMECRKGLVYVSVRTRHSRRDAE